MKKSLLILSSLFVGLVANAQIVNSTATGWGNDYTREEAAPCWTSSPDDIGNYYTITRSDENTYKIMGLGNNTQYSTTLWNGITDGCEALTTIDLSNNATVEIRVKATVATPFSLQLVDENNVAANCDDCSFNMSLTEDFQVFTWDFTDKFICQHACPVDVTDVDPTKINVFNLNIATADYTGTVEIDYIKIGDQEGIVLGTDFTTSASNNAGIQLFPNPAQDKLFFSETLSNVRIYSTTGNVLLTENNTKQMDTSSLDSGIYILQSNEGTFRFTVE